MRKFFLFKLMVIYIVKTFLIVANASTILQEFESSNTKKFLKEEAAKEIATFSVPILKDVIKLPVSFNIEGKTNGGRPMWETQRCHDAQEEVDWEKVTNIEIDGKFDVYDPITKIGKISFSFNYNNQNVGAALYLRLTDSEFEGCIIL